MNTTKIRAVLKFATSAKSFSESLDSTITEDDGNHSTLSPKPFPLSLFSKTFSKLNLQNQSKDHALYLQLLEACYNPHCWTASSISESPWLASLTPDIINRLDTGQGAAPLHYACMHGKLNLVSFLLDKGAYAKIWDQKHGITPLCCAAAFGHLEVCQLLLRHDHCRNSRANALKWAVRGSHVSVVEELFDPNVHSSVTLLHDAIICGNTEILSVLLTKNGTTSDNVEPTFFTGSDSPLHLAASGLYPNALANTRLLLELGSFPINGVNFKHQTPLHLAANNFQAEIITLLLTSGANIQAEDVNGRTALFYLISEDEDALKCLEVLINKNRCNINHQDKKGYTALHLAGLEGTEEVACMLLLNGADFSIKTCDGISALSLLRRKIPYVSNILNQVFDNAVTVNNFHHGDKRDCKVKVNFSSVLPSYTNITQTQLSANQTRKGCRNTSNLEANQYNTAIFGRREDTAKLKCLLDENEESLLLHPVVHAFLAMKWHKARLLFLTTIFYKIFLTLLFSVYIYLPYAILPENENYILTQDNGTFQSCEQDVSHQQPFWYKGMYATVVILYTTKLIIEFLQFLRAPNILLTLHPWISVGVLMIISFYASPQHWKYSACPLQRSMASMGILLAWIDLWIDMARFPQLGMSIRVFFQVLKNFCVFIAPHLFLIVGFLFSFTIIFHKFPEFSTLWVTLPKLARIMAGDNTIATQNSRMLQPDHTSQQIISDFILVYMYTGFVVIVGIVLSNLLIGLAVNDMQSIQAEASKNKVVKQTIILNVLETALGGKWIGRWIPKLAQYTNLFQTACQTKALSFKPYDSRDKRLSPEHKKALLDIATVLAPENQEQVRNNPGTSVKMRTVSCSKKHSRIWRHTIAKFKTEGENLEHKILLKGIEELVVAFLEQKD